MDGVWYQGTNLTEKILQIGDLSGSRLWWTRGFVRPIVTTGGGGIDHNWPKTLDIYHFLIMRVGVSVLGRHGPDTTHLMDGSGLDTRPRPTRCDILMCSPATPT